MMNTLRLSDYAKDNHIHYAELVFREGYEGRLHNHDFYEVFFLISGELVHEINDDLHSLHKHHIQLISPSDTHTLKCSAGMNCHLVNIAFNMRLLDRRQQLLIQELLGNSPYIQALDCPTVIFNTIRHFAGLIKTTEDPVIKSDLLHVLVDNYLMAYKSALITKAILAPPWLEASISAIKKDREYVTGLKRLIELSQHSQEHLTREMKRHYDMTPTQLINDLRLSLAANLLTETSMDILSVIYECGFNNTAHFNRLFKKKFNATPKDYRMANLKILLAK